MMRIRIFRSALNDVRYAAGRPLSVREFLDLPAAEQARLQNLTNRGN